ncbi:MAG TPA: extracellular solute-binding protein [Micavibrio sp.]|jgi:microcin C transport system substrate-binding protein
MLKHIALLALLLAPLPAMAQDVAPAHALAMHGSPKYEADFQHLDYVNPDAPKGGVFHQHVIGTFDSLNPFIVKGVPAAGAGSIYETLLEPSSDEPFTEYGALAASVETPEDRSWAIFNLRPEAKWHDGVPLTADDVVWTFNTLISEGAPFYKAYYANVKKVEALSPTRVKFTFDMAGNRELPLIIGQIAVLPKHYWTAGGRKFGETTLTPPLGSGPYKFGTVKPGESVDYVRVKDWWGKDLPLNKGRYNFDTLSYEYYRDANVALEAFLGGRYDFRQENTAKLWATAYESPAVKDGRIKKETIPHQLPQGAQGFIYNLRRPVFQDRAVRQALAYAFDFEWANKQYAYDSYKRTRSYFSNSEMAATALPDADELKILEPFRDKLPPEVFNAVYEPPKTDGSGNNRDNLRKAAQILDDAGYVAGKDGIRVNKTTGRQLTFEFIDNNPAFERWINPFIQNLGKIGVKVTYRSIDEAQYQNRMNNFDFDMTVMVYPESSSPGNEQREFWGSDRANMPGSRNYIGVKDPVVDALIAQIVSAPTREDLVLRCRALDRVLQWGYYMVPNWHLSAWRIAYWDKFGKPGRTPEYGLPVTETWWAK